MGSVSFERWNERLLKGLAGIERGRGVARRRGLHLDPHRTAPPFPGGVHEHGDGVRGGPGTALVHDRHRSSYDLSAGYFDPFDRERLARCVIGRSDPLNAEARLQQPTAGGIPVQARHLGPSAEF